MRIHDEGVSLTLLITPAMSWPAPPAFVRLRLSMLSCETQLALAAGVATIAVVVTWYLNPAARRWRRPRLHARRAPPPPRCAASVVEKMAGPEQPQQQRETRREAYEPESPTVVHACDAPVLAPLGSGCTHLLELPHELLALILSAIGTSTPSCCCCGYCCRAKLAGRIAGVQSSEVFRAYTRQNGNLVLLPYCAASQGTVGKALASAGACCKTFANSANEAAMVVAGHHGWRLSWAGCTPVRHLSKLEQDKMRVLYHLRAISEDVADWSVPQIRECHAFVDLWITETSLGFIGPLYIDAQVRRQHTLEFGGLLFHTRLQRGFGAEMGRFHSRVCTQLITMMARPGTPLDASWLAARLIPRVAKHAMGTCKNNTRTTQLVGMVELLGQLEPHVLRDNPEINAWLQRAIRMGLVA